MNLLIVERVHTLLRAGLAATKMEPNRHLG